jgi:2-dehydropantoate 2-reductase
LRSNVENRINGTMGDSENQIRKIAVVGAGSVGGYYGARLALHHDVAFLMRRDLEAVQNGGLSVKSVDGDFVLNPVSAFASTTEIGPVDLVILALKATSNHLIEELVTPLLTADTIVLTLQNGMGNEEFLHALFPQNPILGGLCFVCINRGEPGVIHHLAHGKVEMGEFTATNRISAVVDLFTGAGLDFRKLPDIGLARWRKLIWNIPFNGLSIAGGGIDTQQILKNPDLLKRTRTLMQEIINAAAAYEHTIDPSFAEANIDGTAQMGPYRPSSLVDFEAGRAVEADAIWGEPLRRAREAGVETPELESLHQEICDAVKNRPS